jgi:predicted O-methyltransferase YrrM
MNNILFPEQVKYLEEINTKADDNFIKELEEYAALNHVPILDKVSVKLLENLVLLAKPQRVLELGTAIGYTTIRVARKLPEGSKIVSVEVSPQSHEMAQGNVNKAGVTEKVELVLGEAIKYTTRCTEQFDIIFLDADKEDYDTLFNNSAKLLKTGGIIFVDNLLWHGYAAIDNIQQKFVNSTRHIKNFNTMFTSREDFNSVILPVGDGIGLGVKTA